MYNSTLLKTKNFIFRQFISRLSTEMNPNWKADLISTRSGASPSLIQLLCVSDADRSPFSFLFEEVRYCKSVAYTWSYFEQWLRSVTPSIAPFLNITLEFKEDVCQYLSIGKLPEAYVVSISFPFRNLIEWNQYLHPVVECLNVSEQYILVPCGKENYETDSGQEFYLDGVRVDRKGMRPVEAGASATRFYPCSKEEQAWNGVFYSSDIQVLQSPTAIEKGVPSIGYYDERRHFPRHLNFHMYVDLDEILERIAQILTILGQPSTVLVEFATRDSVTIKPPVADYGWNFTALGNYKPGFDPLQRPNGICSALKHRYPLLTVKKELETFFQLDIVHGAKESFLDCQYRAEDEAEVMEIIQSVVKEFPDDEIRIEKWNGDFYRRWITDPADGVWPDEYPSGELEVDTADAQRDSTSSPGAMPRFVASRDASARIDAPTNQYAMERADSFSELMRTRFGVQYDLSVESLKAVDQVVATFHADGPVIDSTIMNYAYYIGEVMRRSLGGHWAIFPESPKRPPVLRIGVHDIAIFDLTISLFDERQPIYPMCLKLQSVLSSQGA